MRYIEEVVTLSLDADKCTGCGMCQHVCPHAVIGMDGGRAFLRDRGACMECGACMRNCPHGALQVRAGVGCAAGVIMGWILGTEPTCDCTDGKACC